MAPLASPAVGEPEKTTTSTAPTTATEAEAGGEISTDVEDAQYESSQWRQYCAGAMACCVSLINGGSYTWPSVALPQLQAGAGEGVVLLSDGPLSDEDASWLASLLYLVGIFSVPFCAWIYPHCSRKKMGYAAAAFMLLQWLVLCATRNVVGLYAARVLSGVAGGLLFFFTPTYLREIAADDARGALGSFMSLLFNAGILIMNAVGGLLSYEALHLMYLVMTCAYFAGFWWLPESPTYLVARGRSAEAGEALRWLRGPRADVASELRALESKVKRQKAEDTTSLRQLCADKASVKGLLLCSVLCANQPLCGFFVVISYAVSIFTEASPSMSPHAASSIVGALCVVGTLLAARLVERVGRKVLYLTSDAVMAICLAALGTYSYLQASPGVDVGAFGWVPVASLSVCMAAVSLAIATLPFVIINEIFLPQAQMLATAIGAVVMQLLGFLATRFFSAVIRSLGLHTCYWFFCAMCALICVYLYFELPETRNRSLESIRKELAGEKGEATSSRQAKSENKTQKETV